MKLSKRKSKTIKTFAKLGEHVAAKPTLAQQLLSSPFVQATGSMEADAMPMGDLGAVEYKILGER